MAGAGRGLYVVHRILIAMAIAFCAGFAVREMVIAARGGGAIPAVLALLSGAASVALLAYFRWWLRTKATALRPRGNTPHPT